MSWYQFDITMGTLYEMQAGMEACYHQVKNLEGELERLLTENKTLGGKVVSMEQSQSDLKDQLTDSENVTKSLTETLDQLVNARRYRYRCFGYRIDI